MIHHINKKEGQKVYLVEETFNKVQHPFMIKILNEVGVEGTYHNIIKAIYDKA